MSMNQYNQEVRRWLEPGSRELAEREGFRFPDTADLAGFGPATDQVVAKDAEAGIPLVRDFGPRLADIAGQLLVAVPELFGNMPEARQEVARAIANFVSDLTRYAESLVARDDTQPKYDE